MKTCWRWSACPAVTALTLPASQPPISPTILTRTEWRRELRLFPFLSETGGWAVWSLGRLCDPGITHKSTIALIGIAYKLHPDPEIMANKSNKTKKSVTKPAIQVGPVATRTT